MENYTEDEAESLLLPLPRLDGSVSLEQALRDRRSVREYAEEPLTPGEVSQLLWAAQGVTADWGARTAPSAGALFPLETYLVVGDVSDLEPGVYRYRPDEHDLLRIGGGDRRTLLSETAGEQPWVHEAAAGIVIGGVYGRTEEKYGDRGERYVHMEAGHAVQNVLLQATALGLSCVPVAGFSGDDARAVLGTPEDVDLLYIVPVGRRIESEPTP